MPPGLLRFSIAISCTLVQCLVLIGVAATHRKAFGSSMWSGSPVVFDAAVLLSCLFVYLAFRVVRGVANPIGGGAEMLIGAVAGVSASFVAYAVGPHAAADLLFVVLGIIVQSVLASLAWTRSRLVS